MRRTILLLSTMTIAVLAVSGAMLFGMGKPAQSQSDPEPPCQVQFCIDKTADPNPAIVGEPITFTITQRCPGNAPGCLGQANFPIVDTLPPEARFTIVSVAPAACTSGENTVTCAENRFITPTQPYTITIVAIPAECGTFTNTVSQLHPNPSNPPQHTARVTFTVEGCGPTVPMTKEQCKKGGWSNLGWPNQGTCISAWNNQNRP